MARPGEDAGQRLFGRRRGLLQHALVPGQRAGSAAPHSAVEPLHPRRFGRYCLARPLRRAVMDIDTSASRCREASPEGRRQPPRCALARRQGRLGQGPRARPGRPSAAAAWVHAYLHRVEGDHSNAELLVSPGRQEAGLRPVDDEWSEIAAGCSSARQLSGRAGAVDPLGLCRMRRVAACPQGLTDRALSISIRTEPSADMNEAVRTETVEAHPRRDRRLGGRHRHGGACPGHLARPSSSPAPRPSSAARRMLMSAWSTRRCPACCR